MVFDLLEALTGELPCYTSPNWNVSDKKNEQPEVAPCVWTECSIS